MAFLLPLVFIVVPILELSLLVWSWNTFGFLETLALIVITGVLGASLARYQGLVTWQRFQAAMARGEMPHKELVDGLLILVAGAVLLTPGFITDTVGFLLLVPPVRALLRRAVAGYLAKRVRVVDVGGGASGSAAGGRARPAPSGEPVIDAEFTVQRSPPKVGDRDGEGVGDSGATGS